MQPTRENRCANCGKPSEYFAEPTDPFCSNRCKLIDVGKMARRGMRRQGIAAA